MNYIEEKRNRRGMCGRPGRNTGPLIIKFILEMEVIIDPEENFDERY